MKRKLATILKTWRQQKKGRLPLLVYGARQVGKTYALRAFGAEAFKQVIYVNFETNNYLAAYFEDDISPKHILAVLEAEYKTKIIPEDTLIIFDEVQLCSRALTALKYFAEDAPNYYLVAAGSLLGVSINREQFSFPVGKVQIANMYPLDFEEFLWATGHNLLSKKIREHFATNKELPLALHNEAMALYKEYLYVGGMPAVVLAYLQESIFSVDETKGYILAAYGADMTKYATKSESVKILEAYDSIPSQLAKDNKKFQYKLIKNGARSSLYGDALDWLIAAGVVLKCIKCEQGYMPPSIYEDLSSFKLYFSDCGLFAGKTQMTKEGIAIGNDSNFKGAFSENYVATTLAANGYSLYYWESKNIAEVDFLLVKEGKVIPVECKTHVNVKSKSLNSFCKRYGPPYAIRISAKNFGFDNGIKSVPLYAAFAI